MKRTLSALALSFLLGSAAQAATYSLDPQHSMVVFKIGHMGISKVWGRFNTLSGTFTTDDAGQLTGARVEVKADSVDTGVPRRDTHLKSADFFNAAQFPTIKFEASAVNATDDGKYELSGNLTLHGVTKPVTLVVGEVGRGRDGGGVERVGAEGTLQLKRTAFGMTNMLDAAGDDVQLFLNFEGAKQ